MGPLSERRYASVSDTRDCVGSIRPRGRTAITVWGGGGPGSTFLTTLSFELWAVTRDVAVQVATTSSTGALMNVGVELFNVVGWSPDRWDLFAAAGGSIKRWTGTLVLDAWGL